ncbi:MAG: UDP-3-O-acyl-N-acetylglucosamine deacetylase [Oligoflexia bacterium]|nr:UDP-3-O-acyl-N-acetylglucosamine deacetylase [Oligoflexia bacterium]
MLLYQRTLAKKVKVTGIGLHSGMKVSLTVNPADSDTGICFRRIDVPGSPIISAEALKVIATENATTIGEGKFLINTVEHLLAVFYGLGINNAYCEIDGPEIPIMDGSGASFVFVLKEGGVANLSKLKNFIVILSPIRVESDDRWAEFHPSSKLIIDSTIVFVHPLIKQQREVFEFSCENFINDICRARTFAMLKDVDNLKRRGLAKGGSLDNAIVVDDYDVINPDGLRFKNEFVKHKILDTLGDISLLGYEIAGKVVTYKSGHYLNNLLCRKLLENPNCYDIVSASSLAPETKISFGLPQVIHQVS